MVALANMIFMVIYFMASPMIAWLGGDATPLLKVFVIIFAALQWVWWKALDAKPDTPVRRTQSRKGRAAGRAIDVIASVLIIFNLVAILGPLRQQFSNAGDISYALMFNCWALASWFVAKMTLRE